MLLVQSFFLHKVLSIFYMFHSECLNWNINMVTQSTLSPFGREMMSNKKWFYSYRILWSSVYLTVVRESPGTLLASLRLCMIQAVILWPMHFVTVLPLNQLWNLVISMHWHFTILQYWSMLFHQTASDTLISDMQASGLCKRDTLSKEKLARTWKRNYRFAEQRAT